MKARLFTLGVGRRQRVALVTLLALIPLSLTAWQGVRVSTLPPGAAVAIPFEGAGWQDKVLTHEGYVAPPNELADAVLAPREMNVTLSNPSPDKKWFLDDIGDGPVPMTIFSKPFDELGGVFIDLQGEPAARDDAPQHDRHSGDLGGRRHAQDARDAAPACASPTRAGRRTARASPYMTLGDDATHVWITDLATNKPRQMTKTPLLATFVTNFDFVNNGKQIVAVFPPDGRTPRPAAAGRAVGPGSR